MRRAIDSSEAEMAESEQIKHKRLEKKKKRKRAASLFGWPGDGRKLRLKREQRRLSRVQSGINDAQRKFQWLHRVNEIHRSQDLEFAKTALEYYEKSQGGDFEILEALYSKKSILSKSELKSNEVWIHVSFIAKPKNADCSDGSPKYFFGELFESDRSRKIEATYCSTFEPRNDPGVDHKCVFCPPVLKCHPSDGYRVGNGKWYEVKHIWYDLHWYLSAGIRLEASQ